MFNIDWEPFNGMSTRPWLNFFVCILLILGWTAIIILLAITSCSPATEETTVLVETEFCAYTEEGRELLLATPTGDAYKINVYQYYDGTFEDPSFLCNGDTYRMWVSDHGYIKAMKTTDGQQIITFETEREAYRGSNLGAYILLFVFWLLTIVFFVLSLVVSKNPEWYPEWLVKILFYSNADWLS